MLSVVEPMVLFVTAYLAYCTAELFHWSGIIRLLSFNLIGKSINKQIDNYSLIACGITQTQYAFENIGSKSCVTIKFATEVMALVDRQTDRLIN